MAVNQCNIPATVGDRDRSDNQEQELQQQAPPQQTELSLRKELIKVFLKELVLFQIFIVGALFEVYLNIPINQDRATSHLTSVIILIPLYLFYFGAVTMVRFIIEPVKFIFFSLILCILAILEYILEYIFLLILRILDILSQSAIIPEAFRSLDSLDYKNPISRVVPPTVTNQFFILLLGTILVVFMVNWKLPFVTVSKDGQQKVLTENYKKKLKRLKMSVRWLGHFFLILLAVLYVYTAKDREVLINWSVLTKPVPTGVSVSSYCRILLTDMILVINVVDIIWTKMVMARFLKFKWIVLAKAKLVQAMPDCSRISMKWIVMMVFMYLPSIVQGLLHFSIYHEINNDFSLALPLAEAVILTMCTAHYEEMRQLHGARNIALNAAPVALVGVLFHCSVCGSLQLVDIAMGIFKGVRMWAVHFGMAKLYK